MNIAIFTDSFFPQVNGIATHCLELCNGLAVKGHHIQLFIPLIDKNKTIQLHPNIEVHSISGIPLGILKDFRITSPYPFEPIHILKQNIPDLIHFHTSFTLGINGIIAAKKLKIPLVGTFHSYFMEPEYLRVLQLDKVHLDTNTQINSLGWNYAKSIFNKAHIVISPSLFTKNDLVKHGLKKPIKVISNGIDVEKIQKRQLKDIPGD